MWSHCKTDGNFGNVSAGVLFSKVAYQRKRFSSWSFVSRVYLLHPNFILVCLWFLLSLVFSHLSEVIFAGFFNRKVILYVAKIRTEVLQHWKPRQIILLSQQTNSWLLVKKFVNHHNRFYFEKNVKRSFDKAGYLQNSCFSHLINNLTEKLHYSDYWL